MLRTVLSHLVFWVVMTIMITTSLVFVVLVYFPFVALKALWLAANGRIDEVTGPKEGQEAADSKA